MGRDSFAFTNELMWTYEFAADGTLHTRSVEPKPENPHRCFSLTRAAREFFYHAAFAPNEPKIDESGYQELVRRVVARNSRCASAPEERIRIPGFADLHELSAAYPEMIRERCGGTWRSYLQRGNWRMIFPVSDRRERKTARKLAQEIREGHLPIVHVYRFPEVRLNHSILLYAVEEQGSQSVFRAYDPNNPGRAAELRFDFGADTFLFERNQYFAGGPIKVYEVFRGWFY